MTSVCRLLACGLPLLTFSNLIAINDTLTVAKGRRAGAAFSSKMLQQVLFLHFEMKTKKVTP
jgi:hypothetical protein